MANIVPTYNPPQLFQRDLDPLRIMRQMMRWDPFQAIAPDVVGERQLFNPAFDVTETDDAYLFMADVPGLRDQDIDISVTGNRITVHGKREQETRQESRNYYTCERTYGSFSRSFTLPDGCRLDDIQANLDNGVLTLNVPKAPEVQSRKINVTAGGNGAKKKVH